MSVEVVEDLLKGSIGFRGRRKEAEKEEGS
jgi:hypothetical protein